MPAVNVSMLGGQLAWRQHDGGHTDGPNSRYFIPWADGFFKRPYTGGAVLVRAVAADQPVSRTDANSLMAHEQLLQKAKRGGIDVYFEGGLDCAAVGGHRLPGNAGQL